MNPRLFPIPSSKPFLHRTARALALAVALPVAGLLSGCLNSSDPDAPGSATLQGNITLAELADHGAVAFIIDGEDWHFFALPDQGETAISAIDPERGTAYGWSRTTPESNDKGFALDLRTNTFRTIQVPGVDRTIIRGADRQGRVVGLANVRATADSYGFLYDPASGEVTEVRRPGATQGATTDLNEAGTMVGYTEFGEFGYVLRNGEYTTLETPGAGRLFPIEINEGGTIVGLWGDTAAWWDVSHGFIAEPAGDSFAVQSYRVANHPTTLNGINDDGVLAGTYYPAGVEGSPRVFSASGASATPRTHPAPQANLDPWVDGIDDNGRIFGHVVINHAPSDPEECGGHGHLHGTACHCDSGYIQDPEDEGMCVAE